MNTIAFLLFISTIGVFLISLAVIGYAGVILACQVGRPIKLRVLEFGIVAFTAQGIVASSHFLLSFFISNDLIEKACEDVLYCRTASLYGFQDGRWDYMVAAVAFALGLWGCKYFIRDLSL